MALPINYSPTWRVINFQLSKAKMFHCQILLHNAKIKNTFIHSMYWTTASLQVFLQMITFLGLLSA